MKAPTRTDDPNHAEGWHLLVGRTASDGSAKLRFDGVANNPTVRSKARRGGTRPVVPPHRLCRSIEGRRRASDPPCEKGGDAWIP